MSCKLCELSLDQQQQQQHQKLGIGSNCTHTPFLSQVSQLPVGVNQNPHPLFVQPLREMMLAAYLFRGKN